MAYAECFFTSGSSASIWFSWILSVMSHWSTTSWNDKEWQTIGTQKASQKQIQQVGKTFLILFWYEIANKTFKRHFKCQMYSPLFYCSPLCPSTGHWTCDRNPALPTCRPPSLGHKTHFQLHLTMIYIHKHYIIWIKSESETKSCFWPWPDKRPGRACSGESRLSQLKGQPQQAWSHSALHHTDTRMWEP